MDFTAQDFREMQSNLFATYDSVDEVIERSSDTLSVMIAVNTVLEVLARSAEKVDEKLTSFELRAREAEEKGGGE